MPFSKNKLEELVKNAFPGCIINIISLVNDDDHYEVHLQSHEFNGLKLIDQHRLFNERLKEIIPKIHALSLKTKTLDFKK
jgi:stress-induced morphogen